MNRGWREDGFGGDSGDCVRTFDGNASSAFRNVPLPCVCTVPSAQLAMHVDILHSRYTKIITSLSSVVRGVGSRLKRWKWEEGGKVK